MKLAQGRQRLHLGRMPCPYYGHSAAVPGLLAFPGIAISRAAGLVGAWRFVIVQGRLSAPGTLAVVHACACVR